MTEVRANVSKELHRSLKQEAAREGLHLKKLVCDILEQYVYNRTKSGEK